MAVATTVRATDAGLALGSLTSFWQALGRGDAEPLAWFLTSAFRARLRDEGRDFPGSLYAALNAPASQCGEVVIPDEVWLLDDGRLAVACCLPSFKRDRSERWVVLSRTDTYWQVDGTGRPHEDQLIGTMTLRGRWGGHARPS